MSFFCDQAPDSGPARGPASLRLRTGLPNRPTPDNIAAGLEDPSRYPQRVAYLLPLPTPQRCLRLNRASMPTTCLKFIHANSSLSTARRRAVRCPTPTWLKGRA
jgi:hypothetical protein